jgi:hypothetical protein
MEMNENKLWIIVQERLNTLFGFINIFEITKYLVYRIPD